MQEIIQDRSRDFESMFVKAWDSETENGLRTEEARSQSQSRLGCLDSGKETTVIRVSLVKPFGSVFLFKKIPSRVWAKNLL